MNAQESVRTARAPCLRRLLRATRPAGLVALASEVAAARFGSREHSLQSVEGQDGGLMGVTGARQCECVTCDGD